MKGECIEWEGPWDKKGYGKVFINGRGYQKAHRMAWEIFYAPIPNGLHVLHWCDNPRCVRITHLHLGTSLDNMREMKERGRAARARWTHCKQGHELPPKPEGAKQRLCMICEKRRRTKNDALRTERRRLARESVKS